MEAVFYDNGLLEYVKAYIEKIQAFDSQNLAQWKKDVAKARRIIMEGVRDHIVLNLHEKETLFTMCESTDRIVRE